MPEIDSWRRKEPFKGPMHKFSFAATYPEIRQRWGQSRLEILGKRLGIEALGKN